MITCDRFQAFCYSSVRNLGKLHIRYYVHLYSFDVWKQNIIYLYEQFSGKSFISITVCVANYLSFNKTRHFPKPWMAKNDTHGSSAAKILK